jgi:hypothetical protein
MWNGEPVSNWRSSWHGWADKVTTHQQYKLGNLPDGTTNTIMFAEGYAGNGGDVYTYSDFGSSTYSAPRSQGGWSTHWSSTNINYTRYDKYNLGNTNAWIFNSSNSTYKQKNSDITAGPVFHLENSMFQVKPKVKYSNTSSNNWNNGTSQNSTQYSYKRHGGDGINPRLPQGNFTGGLLVCMCDGSVHTVNQNVSYQSWKAAVLPSDGEVPGIDF